jgi:hypothetical protein
MLKYIKVSLVGLAFTLLLSACGPSEQEIKSLGFSNAAEMKDIQSKGFKTKQDYETQIAIDEAKAKAEKEAALEAQRIAEMEAEAKAIAEREAERQAQAGNAIKVFKKREWVSGWNRSVNYLNIQSFTDAVTIRRVVFNRGRCPIYYVLTNRGSAQMPIQIQFGDVVKLDLDSPPCDLLEVEVTTNLGTTNYSF